MHDKDCSYLLDSLSEYVDGHLSSELCNDIEKHIDACDDCHIVVDTLVKTVSLYKSIPEDIAIPDGVRERLFARLEISNYMHKEE